MISNYYLYFFDNVNNLLLIKILKFVKRVKKKIMSQI